MKEKVLIFGTGKYYITNEKYIEDIFEIVALIDNDPSKQGKNLNGFQIIHPQEILEYSFDKIFIASMYIDEIKIQLINLGIPENKIISKDDCERFVQRITKDIIDKKFMNRIQKKFNNDNKKLVLNKKKILFCISSLEGGGAEKVLVDLLNNMNYKKYNVSLVVIFNKGIYFNKINNNVNVITLFDNQNEIIDGMDIIKYNSSEYLHKRLIMSKYDVEISFLEGYSTKLISGAGDNTKKISWVHIDLYRYHWTKHAYLSMEEEKECYGKFNNIIFVSKEAKNGWMNLFQMNNSKLSVIYNLFESDNIIKLALENKVTMEKITFVTVGRLSKQKGYDRLIRAHSKLINEGLIHNILIIGIGEEELNLKKLCLELGLNDSVKFIGFKNNPYKYIKNGDVFISSSRVEGYPLVVGEALILGKAIVATKCTGNNEILKYGKYGMLIDNSEDGIYYGIKRVLLNKELIIEYEKRAILSKIEFNKENILSKVYSIIES